MRNSSCFAVIMSQGPNRHCQSLQFDLKAQSFTYATENAFYDPRTFFNFIVSHLALLTAGIEQFDISSSDLIDMFAHTVSLFSFERIHSSINQNSVIYLPSYISRPVSFLELRSYCIAVCPNCSSPCSESTFSVSNDKPSFFPTFMVIYII